MIRHEASFFCERSRLVWYLTSQKIFFKILNRGGLGYLKLLFQCLNFIARFNFLRVNLIFLARKNAACLIIVELNCSLIYISSTRLILFYPLIFQQAQWSVQRMPVCHWSLLIVLSVTWYSVPNLNLFKSLLERESYSVWNPSRYGTSSGNPNWHGVTPKFKKNVFPSWVEQGNLVWFLLVREWEYYLMQCKSLLVWENVLVSKGHSVPVGMGYGAGITKIPVGMGLA